MVQHPTRYSQLFFEPEHAMYRSVNIVASLISKSACASP